MIPSKRNSNLVLVQRKQATTGAWNPTVEWVEDRIVWVSIDPARGREVFKGDELEAVVTHKIRGDFLELDGVTEEMRIVYNDSHAYDPIRDDSIVFDILAVMPNHDMHDDTLIQATAKALRFSSLSTNIPQ